MLDGKTVLVTGGTGTFGKNFIKHILAKYDLKKVIVFSRDEFKQHQLQQEIQDDRLRFFIGDVRDLSRLQRALQGVDVVIHAAALKQVPALEYNPFEAVKTNIQGTQNVIEAAIDQKVSKVLLISTDKAAQPVNLYGATKLSAEKLIIAGNAYTGNATKFGVVRYGNVIGSRGSIIETLLKTPDLDQVKITHPDMTRFWITLDQTYDLVLFALQNMVGGEIVIPKAPSMKLVDLMQTIAPKADQEIIGIRPGEKLHEILLTEDEARHAYELDSYYVILPEFKFKDDYHYDIYKHQGKELAEGFRFASNTNKEWLQQQDLNEMIENFKKEIL